jgi:hypothetical protein
MRLASFAGIASMDSAAQSAEIEVTLTNFRLFFSPFPKIKFLLRNENFNTLMSKCQKPLTVSTLAL